MTVKGVKSALRCECCGYISPAKRPPPKNSGPRYCPSCYDDETRCELKWVPV